MHRLQPSAPALSRAGSSDPGQQPADREAPLPADRWTELAELGQGGMGTVRLVRDNWLQRDVAIKEPRSAETEAQLAREARITAELEHPGIVSVYDVHCAADGRVGYAMQVVRGSSLADLLWLAHTPEERLRYLRPVHLACQAVAFAHAKRIVHRDLSAANIMIGAFGEVQVIDWGLAVRAGEDDAPPPRRAGTPGAMSPEQERGERLDARSDVWSLGALLRLIAPADDDVPAPLDAIIAKATAPAPGERYADAGELAEDLGNFLEGRIVAAHTYTELELLGRLVVAWRRPLVVALVALVALVAVVAFGVQDLAHERSVAERRLAYVLMTQARQAALADRRPEAAVLAAHALAREPLPEARGILATAAAGTAPLRELLQTAPCDPIDVTAAGDALCLDAEGISVASAGQRRWSLSGRFERAAFLGGGALVATVVGDRVQRYQSSNGAPVGAAEAVPARARLIQGPDDAAFLLWEGSAVVRVDGTETRRLPRVCGDDPVDALALSAGGDRWLVACRGGRVAVGAGDQPTHWLDVGAGAPTAEHGVVHTRAFAFVGQELVVTGDDIGTLRLLALDGTPRTERTTLPDGPLVHSLVPLTGGHRAVALLDGAPPIVVSLPTLTPIMRLPRVGVHRVVAVGPDSFVTATRQVSRWSLTTSSAVQVRFEAGVAALASDPRGRYLAVASGPNVNIIDAKTHEVSDTLRWQDGFVKTVDIGPDGRGFGYGFGDRRVFSFVPGEAPTPLSGKLDGTQIKRLVGIGGGEVLALRYSGTVVRLGIDRDQELVVAADASALSASSDRRRVVISRADGQLTCVDRAAGGALALRACGTLAAGLDEPAVHDSMPLVFAARAGTVETVVISGWPGTEAPPWAPLTYYAQGTDVVAVATARQWLVGGGRDGTVFLWRLGEAAPWAITKEHRRRAANVVLLAGGRGVASGGWDGRLAFLALEGEAGTPAEIERRWGLTLDQVLDQEGPRP